MVPSFWIQVGVLAAAAFALGWWIIAAVLRRAAKARRRSARWSAFVGACPTCDPSPGAATYALSAPPGPAGTLSVERDGLCVSLDGYPGRTFWLAWASVYSLDPGQSGGAMLRVAGGVELHLSADACRAVWEAKARVRTRPAQAASPAAAGPAATAS